MAVVAVVAVQAFLSTASSGLLPLLPVGFIHIDDAVVKDLHLLIDILQCSFAIIQYDRSKSAAIA